MQDEDKVNKEQGKKGRNHLKIAFFLIVSISTVYFIYQLINNIDPSYLAILLVNLDYKFLISAFAIYIFMNIIRTYRYFIIFNKQIRISEMFSITTYYNLLTHIIPYRLGELSLIYFAKNQDVEADRSIASLIYIKSQDFFITSLFLLLFAIFTIDFFKVPYIYLISGIFIFIIAIILQLIIFGSKSITNLINKIIIFIQQKIKMIRGNGDISSKSGSTINNTSSDNTESINNLSETHEKEGFLSKIIEKISLIQGNLGDLINLKIYFKYFVLTFIIKVIQLITTLIIFRGLNIQLPFFVILINDLFLAFVDFIPLSLIASLGFYEFTFASLIIVQELKLNSPYSVAFSWHIIGITFQTLIFLIGLGVNLINRGRSK